MKYLITLLLLPLCCFSQNLFHENSFNSIVADHRALHIGDIVTVLVVENSSAQTSTNMQSSKDFQVGIKGGYNSSTANITGGINTGDAGSGQTSRGETVKAALTVKVIHVSPNGNLTIAGDQYVRINGEKQIIHLIGVIRSIDIASDNSILSSRIADAQITIIGQGNLSDATKHGIIYRFLSFLGLT